LGCRIIILGLRRAYPFFFGIVVLIVIELRIPWRWKHRLRYTALVM
jgi:hypothetical protein